MPLFSKSSTKKSGRVLSFGVSLFNFLSPSGKWGSMGISLGYLPKLRKQRSDSLVLYNQLSYHCSLLIWSTGHDFGAGSTERHCCLQPWRRNGEMFVLMSVFSDIARQCGPIYRSMLCGSQSIGCDKQDIDACSLLYLSSISILHCIIFLFLQNFDMY